LEIVEVLSKKQPLGDRKIPLRTPLQVETKKPLLRFEHGFSEAGYFWTTIYLARELGEEGRAGVFVRSRWIARNGYSDYGEDEIFISFKDLGRWVEENV